MLTKPCIFSTFGVFAVISAAMLGLNSCSRRVFFDSCYPSQYHAALISASGYSAMIPRLIEPRKFAQQGLSVSGSLPVQELDRLSSAVLALSAVDVNLRFGISESKHRVVTGLVAANVELVCQRCLEALGLKLSSEVSLAMIWAEEEAKQLPTIYEPWVVAADQADLYEIVEEELLLALPVVAFHDYECVDKSLFTTGEKSPPVETKQNNPFRVLATLKGSSKI